ncbi:MAG TPA: glycoside hydrolase family 1 protein, partial [candidate division WWE3 bacterium]|nr:glycoside hydrolase family 1 protein [candidate division WWE3 bacterium]
HYKKVLQSAKSKGLKTFVTLHHFTSPLWFSKKYGWGHPKASSLFSKYAYKCAQEFGDLVDVYLTINEPQVYLYMSYVKGIWPPSKKNPFLAFIVNTNFMLSHIRAYKSIKKVNKNYKVGIVKNIMWYKPHRKNNLLDKAVSKFMYFFVADFFLLPLKRYTDLIGLNYYFTNEMKGFKAVNPNDVVSDLGWWIYPKGLEKVLLSLKKYNKPIYITENGLADEQDKLRKDFIKQMLTSCYQAINKGVNLKGYFYWSLLDNYEWHEGFWPKFGLISLEKDTLNRIPRKSFFYYAKICKNNSVDL